MCVLVGVERRTVLCWCCQGLEEVRVMLVRGVEGGVSTNSFETVAPRFQDWKGWMRPMEIRQEQNKMKIPAHTGHSKP